MRSKADVLILDEPTAAIDALAEAEMFSHFLDLRPEQNLIIISHRFLLCAADLIIVLESRIQEG